MAALEAERLLAEEEELGEAENDVKENGVEKGDGDGDDVKPKAAKAHQ